MANVEISQCFDEKEVSILLGLQRLKEDGKYIALSLHPPMGDNTIRTKGNRMFVNEGRDGKFEDIREAFYDWTVDKYDSRYQK